MHNKETCLLSIVLCGRNDNYLGDFKYRITSAINYLAKNAAKINRLKDIEVLVVDWNSEIPLSKELCLIPDACEVSTFIIVPPNIASEYNANGHVFNAACAINAGVRRANGKYIMIMPTDILITSVSLQNLLLLLEKKIDIVFDPKKTMLNIGRKLIPWQIVERKPDLDEWERYLQLHSRHLYYCDYHPGLASGMGAILLSKDLWEESQAILESLSGWGWSDVEFGLRINQAYPNIDLSYFGIVVFDMQQSPEERSSIKCHNTFNVSFSFEAGQPDWGLKQHKLEIQKAACKSDASRDLINNSKIAYENKTIKEIVSELTSRKVFEYVEKNIASWNIQDINLAVLESLTALSWYSLNYFPRSYLEFGISKARSAELVAAACPSIEIYGIDPWQTKNGDPTSSPVSTSILMQSVGYRGYLRYVTGDPHTALQRLKDSSAGSLSFDLALFRGDMFGIDAFQQLSGLIPHLSRGGMIVLTYASEDNFQHVWKKVQDEFVEFTYLPCKSGKTGLILTSTLQNGNANALEDTKADFQEDFEKVTQALRPPLKRKRRIHRVLGNISRYPEYAKQIFRFLFERA